MVAPYGEIDLTQAVPETRVRRPKAHSTYYGEHPIVDVSYPAAAAY